MKAIYYFLSISFYLCFVSCNNNLEQNSEHLPYEELVQKNLVYMNMSRPTDSYNYPIYPGKEEWAILSNSQEMVDACQVSKDILSTMSTQAVIQAIWEYPLLMEVFHRFQFYADFEGAFLANNAYLELLNRNDAFACLFERLTLVNPLTIFPRFESQLIELLISQTVFLSQSNVSEKRKIVEIALQNNDKRQSNRTWVNSAINTSTQPITWVLVGRTLVAAGYLPFIELTSGNEQLRLFLDGWIPDSSSELGKTGYSYLQPVYGNFPVDIGMSGKNFTNDL